MEVPNTYGSSSRRERMRTQAQKPNHGICCKTLRAAAARKFLGLIVPIGILAALGFGDEWPQYRGPNGSGVGSANHLPTEFGPDKNVVWKTPVPFGHSSPVICPWRKVAASSHGSRLLP
jgi:hypothetical protein